MLPFYPLFLAAMILVVVADDAFSFLFAWEFMSLSSWALVMAHDQLRENVRAGFVYIVMASFGTLALLIAFGLLAGPDGAYAFSAIRDSHPSAAIAALVLVLVLIGAGSKAGLVPLHAWLPLAHPAAPSHVSALLSGVMTKVAVYAFIRVVFDLMGDPAWWASLVVLALAGITCVMGVLYALMQHDLKRLLAYHTVENIGIIFIGLGLALGVSDRSGSRWPRRSPSPRRCCMCSTTRCSRTCCSWAPARCWPAPASATWSISAASSTACRSPPLPSWSAASPSRRCRRSTASSPNG